MPPPSTRKKGDAELPLRSARASTIEVIRDHLEFKRAKEFAFIERYFPSVADRGSLEYADIEGMDERQADVLAYDMGKAVRYFRSRNQVQRAGIAQFSKEDAESEPSPFSIKARQYTVALRELCNVYGLECPV